MSTHTARRTMGTLFNNDEEIGGLENTMRMLGHKQLATTQRSYVEVAAFAPDSRRISEPFGEFYKP